MDSEHDTSLEKHPDWYVDIPDMRTLILGSYPPHEGKRDYEFYYPNKQNHFWKVLAKIDNYSLKNFEGKSAVDERIEIMKRLHVGVQNLGLRIKRKGKSAKDTDIEIVEFQNILKIIRSHRTLKTILLPGFSGPSSTYHAFLRYLKENGIECSSAPNKPKAKDSFIINIDRPIQCVVVNSTSTQALRVKFDSLIEQFQSVVFRND